MLKLFTRTLPDEEIDEIAKRAQETEDTTAAWEIIAPLLRTQRRQRKAAFALIDVVCGRFIDSEHGLDVLAQVLESHSDDDEVVADIGCATEGARDIDDLNSAPPEHPFFAKLVLRLAAQAERVRGEDLELWTVDGLATAARMCGRQYDELAEESARRRVELDPNNSSSHYSLGLFYKTRGKFCEGMLANQRAGGIAEETREAYEWNLGICATGAGEGDVALDVWKRLSQKIEMGRFDLPEGRYPQCKVRLAERPLAERDAASDSPGQEETIWIERISPCHGIVRSVLYYDIGVGYGDVVLMDGAPITEHRYGERLVPVFPHLATLIHSGYPLYDFAGTQEEAGQLEDCSIDLKADSIVYSHTENFRTLCANCYLDPDTDHERHNEVEEHVVTGRIAAPSSISPEELLAQLDMAIGNRSPCRIFSPDLCRAAGLDERARFEQRRFDMLSG